MACKVQNKEQEGYNLMNSGSLPSCEQHGVSLQPEWQRQLAAWRDLLAQCASKPNRKRVHALRSLTLRLRTVLEFLLEEHAAESTCAHAFTRWNREGKKLRRALEPVRNADVYMARLAGLRENLAGSPDSDILPSSRCLRETGKLLSRLERRRRKGVDRLMAVMDARNKHLNRLSEEMEAALAPRMPSGTSNTRQVALRLFSELADEVPGLDSANLHAYRKRIKKALYLAEISAPTDPEARQLAAVLRKMHVAAGEWHDWQQLASEAERVLPDHGKQDGLVPVLNQQAEAALKRALSLCRRSPARFFKSTGETRTSQQRKPVASVPIPAQFANATNLSASSSH
jgi:CHAD domain-containing protein